MKFRLWFSTPSPFNSDVNYQTNRFFTYYCIFRLEYLRAHDSYTCQIFCIVPLLCWLPGNISSCCLSDLLHMYWLFEMWKKIKNRNIFYVLFTYFVQCCDYTYCCIEYNGLYSFMTVIYPYKLFYLHWSLTNILHSFVMCCILCSMEIAYF